MMSYSEHENRLKSRVMKTKILTFILALLIGVSIGSSASLYYMMSKCDNAIEEANSIILIDQLKVK